MQRPVMDPGYCQEQPPERQGVRWGALGALWRRARRLLMVELFWWRRDRRLANLDGSPGGRLLRGILYRLAVVALLLPAASALLVYVQTHRGTVAAPRAPREFALFYEPIRLLSDDEVGLEAKLIPVLDARRVLTEKDAGLRRKRPAVILVPDQGGSGDRWMALVRPLHQRGMVVLLLTPRGGDVGQTFGLDEARDVRAAVGMLRRRSFVDPMKIAVVGAGSGANAALIAAGQDAEIAAVVLEAPLHSGAQALDRMVPAGAPLGALRPLCRWMFELGYGVDLGALDLRRHADVLADRPVLLFGDAQPPSRINRAQGGNIVGFLSHHLLGDSAVAANQ